MPFIRQFMLEICKIFGFPARAISDREFVPHENIAKAQMSDNEKVPWYGKHSSSFTKIIWDAGSSLQTLRFF